MTNILRVGRALGLLAGLLAWGLAQAQTTYTFTQYKNGSGTGTVTSNPAGIDCGSTCSAGFASGTSLTLTAAPTGGSIFTGWSGYCSGSAATCTLTMTGARYAYATFQPPTMALTVSASGTSGATGGVTSNPAGIDCGSTCSAAFATNSSVTLTATPGANSQLQYWSGCTSSSGLTCSATMSSAKTVYAVFAPSAYPLAVATSGTDTGTVTSSPAGIDCGAACNANFANGSAVTLTAVPASGLTFQGWSGGACSGMASTCTLTMNAAKNVIAGFGDPTSTYYYDANGNLTQVTDPLGRIRKTSYDALDRPYLVQEPSPTTVGATQGQITTAYDGQDQTATITDPRNLQTSYSVDGLGNLTSLTSPDTGTTTATYDEAGNLKTRTDARGITVSYQYDALNRLTQIAYGDQTVTLTWDSCANGVGRLCRIADGSGSTTYTYDDHGRVLTKTQTIGSAVLTVRYDYTDGRLTRLTLPSGKAVEYGWTEGQISRIGVDGADQLSAIAWQPFGPVSGWTWGNGQATVRQFDRAGRLKSTTLGNNAAGAVDTRGLAYDAAGRITALVDGLDATLNQGYAYDGLDRLTWSRLQAAGLTTYSYAYDLSGNRTNRTLNGTTTTYATAATSNRLMNLTGGQSAAYSYDAAGNITSDGTRAFGYDNAGRRVWAKWGSVTTSFTYNALGQRVKKAGTTTTLYAYDEQGQLLGEYDAAGNPIEETVWLQDIPVLTLQGGAVYYVHTDHLNTPRRITRPSDNKPVWMWEAEPFGNGLPDQNPAGLGNFVYNLRMPGQVYDLETGQFYNWHRYYDPGTGRYTTSDPIGLAGGINTYAYAGSNPLSYSDPQGLCVEDACIVEVGIPLLVRWAAPRVAAAIGGAVLANSAADNGPPPALPAPGGTTLSPADQSQKDWEWSNYHNRCDNPEPPPPGADLCAKWRWQMKQKQACFDLRNEFTRKWYNGNFDPGHLQYMNNLKQSIANLADKIKRLCGEQCQ